MKTTKAMAQRWGRILLGLIALHISSLATVHGQTAPLDIMLLIDNSPSNSRTDPDNLRINAAKFLLDYVEIVSHNIGFNCRAGVVNFGGRLGETITLRPLQGGVVRDAVKHEKIPFTDFRLPLDFALKEFMMRSFDTSNKMAVILFTDGTPELGGKLLLAEDKVRYFKGDHVPGDKIPAYNLNRLVSNLQEASTTVFVVAVGDSPEDAQLWQNLIPPEHYFSINSTTNLAIIFHRIIVDLIGVLATDKADVSAARPYTIELPPYLEQAVFSFIKDRPEATISVNDPTGKAYQSTTENRSRELHEVFVISDPAEGIWQVQVTDGSAQMFMDKWPPKLEARAPATHLSLGQTAQLSARLLRNRKVIVDTSLKLIAQIKAPSGQTLNIPFRRRGEGFFNLAIRNLNESGNYVITVLVELRGKPYKVSGGRTAFEISTEALPQANLWENKKAFWQAAFIMAMLAFGASLYVVKLKGNISELKIASRRDESSWKKHKHWGSRKLDKDGKPKNTEALLDIYKQQKEDANKKKEERYEEINELTETITEIFESLEKEHPGDYTERHRKFIYDEIALGELEIKALSPVLLERWAKRHPRIMIREFFDLLTKLEGFEAMKELAAVKTPNGWKSEDKERAAHLQNIARATYGLKEGGQV